MVTIKQQQKSNHKLTEYVPTFSHEHGVYVMLFISFLTGAATAQNWTFSTTLALVCAFCAFQAEHPLVLQVKQRKSIKTRLLLWGGIYTAIALSIAVYLLLSNPLLSWIYIGGVLAFCVDIISVWYREQKGVFNELVTFAAVCLSCPFAYVVTTGNINTPIMSLWLLNTLFFASSIFTVKLRKPKHPSVNWVIAYHAIASLIIMGLVALNGLSWMSAIAFIPVLFKLGLILRQKEWYCHTKIQYVALLETGTALLYLIIASLSLLPAHLT